MSNDLTVRVEIGPVGGDTTIAWIAYGRDVIDHIGEMDDPSVARHVIDGFRHLLDEWSNIARPGEPFHFATDRSAEEVEFLMKGLFEIGLAVEAEHEAGRMPLRPPEADEFHILLVQQILAEVEKEGPTSAQFVEMLRTEWGIAGQP